ncbi:transposase [Dactylosporangium salmoneum]|uniref:Transposase IS204/IS1001/IS1096/IS1165 DDE domain-containing protein n=1 Tax=Dactylosporangium salmoneum TaxID=53361 RepID=A0ABN3H536_9ACTN
MHGLSALVSRLAMPTAAHTGRWPGTMAEGPVTWAGDSLDAAHKTLPKPVRPIAVAGLDPAQTWRKVRATLRAAAENLDHTGHAIVEQLRLRHRKLWRAWQLKEQLRELYRTITPADAPAYLKRWITAAKRSRINGFISLARRVGRNFDGIINAVQLGLSNSLTEGLNAGIRLIQARAHGYANLDNLIEMIYLCHGDIPTPLPTQTH